MSFRVKNNSQGLHLLGSKLVWVFAEGKIAKKIAKR